jgi:ABC-type sulfate transport system substrate-binding protein
LTELTLRRSDTKHLYGVYAKHLYGVYTKEIFTPESLAAKLKDMYPKLKSVRIQDKDGTFEMIQE